MSNHEVISERTLRFIVESGEMEGLAISFVHAAPLAAELLELRAEVALLRKANEAGVQTITGLKDRVAQACDSSKSEELRQIITDQCDVITSLRQQKLDSDAAWSETVKAQGKRIDQMSHCLEVVQNALGNLEGEDGSKQSKST
jgi:hypothetical protein